MLTALPQGETFRADPFLYKRTAVKNKLKRSIGYYLSGKSRLKLSKSADRSEKHMKVIKAVLGIMIDRAHPIGKFLTKVADKLKRLCVSVRGLTSCSVKAIEPVDLYKITSFSEIGRQTVLGIHFYTGVYHFIGITDRLMRMLVVKKVVKSACHERKKRKAPCIAVCYRSFIYDTLFPKEPPPNDTP